MSVLAPWGYALCAALMASSCSRTIPSDMAEADLRVLGDGVAPGPVTVPAPVATGPGWLLPLAAALLLLVVVPAATWALLRSDPRPARDCAGG